MSLQESVCSVPRLWTGGIAMLAMLCLTATADASMGLVKQLGGPEDERAFGSTMHRMLLQSEYSLPVCSKHAYDLWESGSRQGLRLQTCIDVQCSAAAAALGNRRAKQA